MTEETPAPNANGAGEVDGAGLEAPKTKGATVEVVVEAGADDAVAPNAKGAGAVELVEPNFGGSDDFDDAPNENAGVEVVCGATTGLSLIHI